MKESGKWNDILVDIKLFDGINGLTDSMKQQITEAIRKIIVSFIYLFILICPKKRKTCLFTYTAVLLF